MGTKGDAVVNDQEADQRLNKDSNATTNILLPSNVKDNSIFILMMGGSTVPFKLLKFYHNESEMVKKDQRWQLIKQ